MTWNSIPGPKHTFLLVTVQPVCSNFEKKIRHLGGKWSFSWHSQMTGITLVAVQQPVNRNPLDQFLVTTLIDQFDDQPNELLVA